MSEQDTLKKCTEVFPGLDEKKEDFGIDQLRRIAFATGHGDKPPSGPTVQELLKDLKIESSPTLWTTSALAAKSCMTLNTKFREAELDKTTLTTILSSLDTTMAESILKKGPNEFAPVMQIQGEPKYNDHRNVRPGEWMAPSLTARESRVKAELEKIVTIDVALIQDKTLTMGPPKFHIGVRPNKGQYMR